MVTGVAMKYTFTDFLAGADENRNIMKFIRLRIDVTRAEGARLAA